VGGRAGRGAFVGRGLPRRVMPWWPGRPRAGPVTCARGTLRCPVSDPGGTGRTGVPGCGGGAGGGAGRGAAAGRARPAARRGAVGGVGGAAWRAGSGGGAVAAARRGAGGALRRAHGRVPPPARGAPAPGARICACASHGVGRVFTRSIAWRMRPRGRARPAADGGCVSRSRTRAGRG